MKIVITKCFEGAPEVSTFLLDTDYIPHGLGLDGFVDGLLSTPHDEWYTVDADTYQRWCDWNPVSLNKLYPDPPCTIDKCIMMYVE